MPEEYAVFLTVREIERFLNRKPASLCALGVNILL